MSTHTECPYCAERFMVTERDPLPRSVRKHIEECASEAISRVRQAAEEQVRDERYVRLQYAGFDDAQVEVLLDIFGSNL